MSEDKRTTEAVVFQIVTSYVFGKLESKHGLKWDEKLKGTSREGEYNDKRSKIARDAFLAVRARTGADFIDYFASTLCSMPQRLRDEQTFIELSRQLMTNTDQIRTLTLLALSARS